MAISTWSTSRGEGVLVASAVFTSLATILAALRVYTRGFIVKQTGLDDWIILVSLVSFPKKLLSNAYNIQAFSWAFFGLTVGGQFYPASHPEDVNLVLEVSYGMGEHTANLPRSILSTQLKVSHYTTDLISVPDQ